MQRLNADTGPSGTLVPPPVICVGENGSASPSRAKRFWDLDWHPQSHTRGGSPSPHACKAEKRTGLTSPVAIRSQNSKHVLISYDHLLEHGFEPRLRQDGGASGALADTGPLGQPAPLNPNPCVAHSRNKRFSYRMYQLVVLES